MYKISKRMEIAGSHQLKLSYDSPCSRLHGHNWIVTVFCKSEELNQDGMVVDFAAVKKAIHGRLDHQYLNEVVSFNPTAENIAKWICSEVDNVAGRSVCYRVDVQESEGNVATYEV